MNTKRITRNDVKNNQFYQMPKFLFEGTFKEKLTNDARVLYALLKERHSLSLKNNWVNENKEVYLLFSRKNMQDMLGISKNPTKNAIDLLKKYNLVQEERQGQGKPNMIYLMAINVENTKKVKIRRSEQSDIDGLNSPNVTPSNTNLSKTDFNNNNKEVVVSKKTLDIIKKKTKNTMVKENIIQILEKTNASEEQLLQMIDLMTKSNTIINNPIGWIIKSLNEKYKSPKAFKNTQKNGFHNFQSGKEYTEEELLSQLGLSN